MLQRTALLTAIVLSIASAIFGQFDPDPNSPTPVLLADGKSDRVWAEGFDASGNTKGAVRDAFRPNRNMEVTLRIQNVQMLPGEDMNSVRAYLRQRSGKTFELQNLSMIQSEKGTHALTVRLFDKDGFRGQPVADGESLIYVTWRGLRSNVLKIRLGNSDAEIKVPAELADRSGLKKEDSTDDYVGYRWSGDRIRFLEQAAFGPSTLEDSRLRRIGIRTWLAEQFERSYPTFPFPNIDQKPTAPPSDCQLTTFPSCYREHYTMGPLQRWFFTEALYGDAQLRHRVAWALSQIWVTSGVGVQQSSHQIAYFKTVSENALGNYRDLMHAVTLNPAMGHYLDMARSTKTNPNENYPREILQLFSIGLYKLNPDGTPQLDNEGRPIDTYDQQIINDLSKVFTGWTFCNQTCTNSRPGIVNYKDPMIVVPTNHDTTAKTLLDYPNAVHRVIPACEDCTTADATRQYANESLSKALDNIFNHPNVGPFIGRLLIQHLVTSDPSPAYVQRVAAAFDDNGLGVRGDMKSVIRAILLDPEARGDIKTAPRYGKLREPVQLITNLGRIFPAKDFAGLSRSDGALGAYSTKLGQNPFNAPTVFNYFTPTFVVPGTTINAPEFEILNTGHAVSRTNFLHTLVFEGLTANATDSLRGTSLDTSEFDALAAGDPTGNAVLDALSAKMMHGTLSAAHREAIRTAMLAVPETDPSRRVRTAVYLLAASSQYQVQR